MSESSTELAMAIMVGLAETTPIFDAADGIRADLEKRGWSPTASEQIAQQWLMIALAKAWS